MDKKSLKKKAHYYIVMSFIGSLPFAQAKAATINTVAGDTIIIKFGEYYIDKGEANLPLMQIIDKKTQTNVISLKNKDEILIEVNSGLFNKYETKADVVSSNGTAKKLKGNQFLLTPNRKNNKEMLELKVTHDLKGDVVFVITREWADKEKGKYNEKIDEYKSWVQTIWLSIK